MIRVQIETRPTLACCGKEQPNNLANLPKYAVQGRGATKPLAPESPRTASLKHRDCILYCCSVLLLLHVPHLRA